MSRPADDPDADDLIGIRGPGDPSPRWAPVSAMFEELQRAHLAEDEVTARAINERILSATLVDDVDAEGLDLRARALSNLSAGADVAGRLDESLRLAGECLEACRDVTSLIGNERRTDDVRAGTLVNRAQTLYSLGRFTDALADLDEAGTISPSSKAADATLLTFSRHNNRGTVLLALDEWEQAREAAQTALDLALRERPALAPQAYTTLAVIASRTGDRAGGLEQLQLARELFGDDLASAATVEENLARFALDQGDLAAAEEHFTAAEAGYQRAGISRSVAGCRYGNAAVLLQRGRLGPARKLARAALDDFQDSGDVPAQIETALLLGDIFGKAMRYVQADEYYLMARNLCAETGSPHELARIDVHRAGLAQRAAKTVVRPKERLRRREAALQLALPAALATDALRHRFAPGPVRERWVTEVSGQALAITFELMVQLHQTRLAAELAELMASSVTLEAAAERHEEPLPSATPVNPFAGAPAGEDASDLTEFALTAGPGPIADDVDSGGSDRLALPPRIRFLPGENALEEWISEAEDRYGIPLCSDEVIEAW